jgi:uncharacterized protein (TIGR03492 family)
VPSITIVSNGHGEDVIGASLARALRERVPGATVRAFPVVDEGSAYRSEAIPRLGPCRALPSGGLTLHSTASLVADVRAGFVGMTLAQIAALMRLRSDVVVVVGDIYAQTLAAFTRSTFRAVVQPLVSAHHGSGAGRSPPNRYFMERIRYPERALMRHLASVVYTRDEATAAWLEARGVRNALALGNPMVDRIEGRVLDGIDGRVAVALLPGTRAHTPAALALMAEALASVPDVTGLVAWSGGALPPLPGWVEDRGAGPVSGRTAALRRGATRLWVVEGRFGDVLASARIAIGTAGTANEQAAARGVPVVSFPLEPSYGRAFLQNQKRLLGEALTLSDPDPGAIAAAARGLLGDDAARAQAGRIGRQRMGAPGGSRAIALDLLERASRVVPALQSEDDRGA